MKTNPLPLALSLCIAACGEVAITGAGSLPNEASLAKGPPGSGNVVQVSLPFAFAYDINQQGQVVGYLRTTDRRTKTSTSIPTLWIPSVPRGTTGTLVKLDGQGWAYGINDDGQVTGMVLGPQQGAVWDDTTHFLGAAYALAFSPALADGSRLLVGAPGTVWRVRGRGAAFEVLSLAQLPGGGEATAANASQVVVGQVWVGGGPSKWQLNGASWVRTALALPLGSTGGAAEDINAAGTIVGGTWGGVDHNRPVVWNAATGTPAILPLGASGSLAYGSAWGINDAGMIVGDAGSDTCCWSPYLWVPAPGGGYTAIPLGGGWGSRDLTEPYVEGGSTYVNVAGGGSGALLWKVRLQ